MDDALEGAVIHVHVNLADAGEDDGRHDVRVPGAAVDAAEDRGRVRQEVDLAERDAGERGAALRAGPGAGFRSLRTAVSAEVAGVAGLAAFGAGPGISLRLGCSKQKETEQNQKYGK